MPYVPIVAPNALSRIRNQPLPAVLTDEISRQILLLAEDPQTLGRTPPCPPYVPVGYIYHFHHELSRARRFYFTVFFVYGPNVNQLTVTAITIQPEYERDPADF
jgi:hypothetical protein